MQQKFLREKAKKAPAPQRAPEPTVEEINATETEQRYKGYDEKYAKYQDDLVGFIEEVLGETLTDDQKKLCRSVVRYSVTLGKSANATGKTYIEARVAIWAYLCFPGVKVFTSAAPPEDNLRNIMWAEIGSIIQQHPELFIKSKVTDLSIIRNTEEFIKGLTIPVQGTRAQRMARFSGKHAPFLFFIIDEGDALPPEIYEAIDSCMQGGHGRLFIMFNPRSPMGPLYEMEVIGAAKIVELSAFTHPNVITGEDVVPGAVTREKVVLRINRWSRPLVEGERQDEDCFEVPEFLEGYRCRDEQDLLMAPLQPGWRKVTNAALCYMVLAKYPSGGIHQLIKEDWIIKARNRWEEYVKTHGDQPPAQIRPYAGHDVASEGEDWNVLMMRYENWLAMPDRWQGVDVNVAVDRGAAICKSKNAAHVFVDATGVGAGGAGKYRKKGLAATPVYSMNRATKNLPYGSFYRMRDQCMWQIREWLRDDDNKESKAMLPPNDALLQELRVLKYQNNGGQIHVTKSEDLKELLQRSPDDLSALAVTFAPIKKRAQRRGSTLIKRKLVRR